ncbi:hypothetical protein, partial [Chitinimonas sp.]|uniref:hypothetical protein n=1 Tax=Chitinimonas sp. TaxID=1934313 RepID=UPI0035B19538
FSLVLNWIHTIIMSLFLGWWLRLGNRWQDRDSSLFPLMVLVALPTVLAPLLMLLPDAAAGAVLVLLAIYQTAVLLSALTRATGVKLGHVIVGRLAFLPLELLLWMVAMSFAASLGWIDLDAMSKQLQAPATSTQPGAL